MSKPWYELGQAALDAKIRRILFWGPPGFGKSKFAQLWAEANGWEYIRFTMIPSMDPSHLLGHYIVQEGSFAWYDGYISRAWNLSNETGKNAVLGVVIQIDEISHMGPDITSTMHNVLDDEEAAVLYLQSGDVLRPAPNKIIYVATMNDQPEDLPEALRDRFTVDINVDVPHPAILNMLQPDIREAAKKTTISPDPARRLSMRKWIDFALQRPVLGDELSSSLIWGDRYREILDAIEVAKATS